MTLRKPSCYRLLVSFGIALSTAMYLPAWAGEQPAYQEPGTTVKWADLDLNTDGGRRALLDRLSKAATRVCERDAFLHSDIGYPMVYGTCHDRTLAAAVQKIHHQQLSALLAATSRPAAR